MSCVYPTENVLYCRSAKQTAHAIGDGDPHNLTLDSISFSFDYQACTLICLKQHRYLAQDSEWAAAFHTW